MIYDYLKSLETQLEPDIGQVVWVLEKGEPHYGEPSGNPVQMVYRGDTWFDSFQDFPQPCADTREELLTHLISQKREAIAELERAIEGLDAMREVEV